MEKVFDNGGEPFKTKDALVASMTEANVFDHYDILPMQGGDGWKGYVKSKPTQAIEKQNKKVKTKKVRVSRVNVDPDNADLIIGVCANDPKNRKKFYPGEEVELTETEIDILRKSKTSVQLTIPPDSGIYKARDPEVVARNQYPGMMPKRDHVTNMIIMVRQTPKYTIEMVD